MDVVKDYPSYLDYPKPCKAMTNADRIRGMGDEELTEFIGSILQCKFCKFELWGGCKLLEWLQQPAEEDGYAE